MFPKTEITLTSFILSDLAGKIDSGKICSSFNEFTIDLPKGQTPHGVVLTYGETTFGEQQNTRRYL